MKYLTIILFLSLTATAWAQDMPALPDMPSFDTMPTMDSDMPSAEPLPADDLPPMDLPAMDIASDPFADDIAPVNDVELSDFNDMPDLDTISVPAGAPNLPPIDSGEIYDMSNPFAPPPPDMIAPMQLPDVAKNNGEQSNLPLPLNNNQQDFFQSINGLPALPNNNLPPIANEPVELDTEIADAKPVIIRKRRLPLVRFNYKSQTLPSTIYKHSYDRKNRHLPPAMHQADYDAATFAAAASNNLNGVRAMLNAGRNANMRNAQGQSLAMVAQASGAHTVKRYLNAKGVY